MELTGVRTTDGRRVRVRTEGAVISAVDPIPGEPGDAEPWIAPGFHDLQLNGYAGQDFSGATWGVGAEWEPDVLLARVASAGVALFCPTLITASRPAMVAALRRLDREIARHPGFGRAVTGIHLEGPWIAVKDGPRGAHPREHVRPPDIAEFDALQDAAAGRIRLVTLAPEVDGALAFIEALAARGVVVALGHTGASPARIREAVVAGASLSTHLGNGCRADLPRHPNHIWSQLAEDGLTATLIADGRHLPPEVVRCVVRCKGAGRVALVSDAVALGGLPPGLYADGVFEVTSEGWIRLAGTAYLAGAGRLLDAGLANLLRWSDLDMADAVRAVTEAPARILGLEAHRGRLEAGCRADITLFHLDAHGEVAPVRTVCGGVTTWSAGSDITPGRE